MPAFLGHDPARASPIWIAFPGIAVEGRTNGLHDDVSRVCHVQILRDDIEGHPGIEGLIQVKTSMAAPRRFDARGHRGGAARQSGKLPRYAQSILRANPLTVFVSVAAVIVAVV